MLSELLRFKIVIIASLSIVTPAILLLIILREIKGMFLMWLTILIHVTFFGLFRKEMGNTPIKYLATAS